MEEETRGSTRSYFYTLANFCSTCIKNRFFSLSFVIHSTMPGTALDVPKLQISSHLFFLFNFSPQFNSLAYVTFMICTGPEIQN